tara:strand:- start:6337 stop:6642 length:306 start_codon:yes stop_codon:yes gene_type:complete
MNARFIYARTAANDAACVNIANIKTVEIDSDNSLHITFTKSDGGAGEIQFALGTVDDATEKSVVLDVTRAIAGQNSAVIVLKDDVTGDGMSVLSSVDTITT